MRRALFSVVSVAAVSVACGSDAANSTSTNDAAADTMPDALGDATRDAATDAPTDAGLDASLDATSDGDAATPPSDLPSCDEPLFVDAVADAKWVNVDLTPGGGASSIRDAIRSAQTDHPTDPVRIRLAPGTYADDLGGEIYAQHIERTASAPLWIVATDRAPNHTTVMQGFNFVGVAYVALEGMTIGPASVGAWNGSTHADPQPLQAQAGVHVAGAAKNGKSSALKADGSLDTGIYGQYEPSHHVVVRGMTIQNIFGSDDPSGEFPVGQDHDGMKFNQVQDLWVLDNSVSETSRHGIDDVGVHHAAFCRNVVSRIGAGFGIEAKGGSMQIVYERNVLYHVRRFELGGENTDATYYWSADGAYDYEAKRVVARDNLIVDAREALLEFSGCESCAAIDDSFLYTAGYVPPLTDSGDANGGDGIRAHDSKLLGADEGAGSDCVTWDDTAKDYVDVTNCWNVGSHAPAPIGRALKVRDVVLLNDLFDAAGGTWSKSFGGASAPTTIPCPMNLPSSTDPAIFSMDHDLWWNGGKALPTDGCTAMHEGAHSLLTTADPKLKSTSIGDAASAPVALTPGGDSALLAAGLASPADAVAYDYFGVTHPAAWCIGAVEPVKP